MTIGSYVNNAALSPVRVWVYKEDGSVYATTITDGYLYKSFISLILRGIFEFISCIIDIAGWENGSFNLKDWVEE